jgi:hypothetical protein
MKNQSIFAAAALSLFVMTSSCKKDLNGTNPTGTAVKFSSAITGQIKTKALNNQWESTDAIGVFMKNGTGLSNVLAANKKYATTGDGTFAPATTDQAIFYPQDGSTIDFMAYYPYKTSVSANIYAVDLTNQTTQSAIDLLYTNNAVGLSKTSTNANLVFTHQLSKVEFTVKNGAGVADLTGLSTALAGLNTKADFNLATGTLSNASQAVDITAKTSTQNSKVVSEAIILPTADASGKVVTFTLPAGQFKLTLPANTKFEAGKRYTYEIELKNAAAVPVAVALTATITDWTTVPSGSYTVGEDVTTPPVATEQTLYTETFGTGAATARPKIAAYTGWANTGFTFSDSYGAADLRTISAYPDNIHVWLPAAKDASLKIDGINVTGFAKLKIKYDLAPNASSASSVSDVNVITVKINGVAITVPSRALTNADNNKFVTVELSNIPAAAVNTIEFFGAAAANTLGMRLDNVTVIGVN